MKESGQAGGTLLRYRSVVGFYMMSVCMSVCTCRAREDKKGQRHLVLGGLTSLQMCLFPAKVLFFLFKVVMNADVDADVHCRLTDSERICTADSPPR